MNRYTTPLIVLLAIASIAQAQTDRVRTPSGTLSGQVTDITPLEVTLQRNNREEQIPVSDIRSIQFGAEPSELTQARVNASNGGYDKALALLAKIDRASLRDENVKQEVAYYTALSNVKRALLGAMDLAEAGGQLNAFVNANRQSYHQWEAQELLGDLLVAMDNYPAAEKKYELLARAPWPSYQMRSAVLSGRALQAQGKHAEAIERFTAAEQLADESAVGKSQLLAAKLGLRRQPRRNRQGRPGGQAGPRRDCRRRPRGPRPTSPSVQRPGSQLPESRPPEGGPVRLPARRPALQQRARGPRRGVAPPGDFVGSHRQAERGPRCPAETQDALPHDKLGEAVTRGRDNPSTTRAGFAYPAAAD